MKPNLEFLATNETNRIAAYSHCDPVRGFISRVVAKDYGSKKDGKVTLELFYKSAIRGQIEGEPSIQFDTITEKKAFYTKFGITTPKQNLEFKTITVYLDDSVPKAISMTPLKKFVKPNISRSYVPPRVTSCQKDIPIQVHGVTYKILDGLVKNLMARDENTQPFSSYAPQIAKLMREYYTENDKSRTTFTIQLPRHEKYSRITVKKGTIAEVTYNRRRVAKPQEERSKEPSVAPEEQEPPKKLARGVHRTRYIFDELLTNKNKNSSPSSNQATEADDSKNEEVVEPLVRESLYDDSRTTKDEL